MQSTTHIQGVIETLLLIYRVCLYVVQLVVVRTVPSPAAAAHAVDHVKMSHVKLPFTGSDLDQRQLHSSQTGRSHCCSISILASSSAFCVHDTCINITIYTTSRSSNESVGDWIIKADYK